MTIKDFKVDVTKDAITSQILSMGAQSVQQLKREVSIQAYPSKFEEALRELVEAGSIVYETEFNTYDTAEDYY